jgi:serine/threonine protein phosphatase 1
MLARRKLRQMFAARQRVDVETASVPDGMRVYAIGDIHGRPDLVERIHELILQDMRTANPIARPLVVYLGDYVDRGLHSREVIDTLLDRPLPGFEAVYLRGNHDQQLLDFLANPASGIDWMRYGGDATLYSYGVRLPRNMPRDLHLEEMSRQLRDAIPTRHLAFYEGLGLMFDLGDFLFVHAGVHPEKPLEDQALEDVLWIREEFLESDFDLGKVIVHGHSVTRMPEVRMNRIGVDTGAVFSNALTCLVLEGTTKRFLSTR